MEFKNNYNSSVAFLVPKVPVKMIRMEGKDILSVSKLMLVGIRMCLYFCVCI